MKWKLPALIAMITLSVALIPPPTAADAPGKGDTMLAGYTSKKNSGLKMSLGSTVWLPQLKLDFYSGEPQYEWHILIDGNVNRSGDFQDGPWESIEMNLPQGKIDFELQIGHHAYTFNPVVSNSLAGGDDPAIEGGPTIKEIPQYMVSQMKWVHGLMGAIGAVIMVPMAYVSVKWLSANKWGKLKP